MPVSWTLVCALALGQLPGTQLLNGDHDFAKVMVEGIDKYLDRELTSAVQRRGDLWKPDYASLEAYDKSVAGNRARLRKILGVIDERVPPEMQRGELLASTPAFKAYGVRWSVLPGVDGEGLLLEPTAPVRACVVAIPDADETPESVVGLVRGGKAEDHFARRLVEAGCKVIVPTLIDRRDTWSGSERIKRVTNQTHREFIYRMSYEMGRHVIGYEIQRVLAVLDNLASEEQRPPLWVYGRGEGGLLALYAGALDTRVQTTVVVGHFGPRETLYDEPIYRNVWKLLREFGDAEVTRLIAPRTLVVQPAAMTYSTPPLPREFRRGAAPGKIATFDLAAAQREMSRVRHPQDKDFPRQFQALAKDDAETFDWLGLKGSAFALAPLPPRKLDVVARQKRQFDQLVAYTQNLQVDAARQRQALVWNRLDTSSMPKYEKSTEPLRDYFWQHVIGKLPEPTMPLNPRTRLLYDTPRFKGYEVVLDVYDDVVSYGVLLVPNDLKPGEKRPCIVCQHGLEGRPVDVVNPKGKTKYYNSFGAALAEQGYIVFAPQNPYIFKDQFRQLVRKANPVGLSLYSFIVRQHERILDFLETLPFVDAAKIAYYGLSYGGKVAMRIPALLMRYCLSICSGDFNEWIWKNITLDWGGSYMFTGEYEMYEFDLGNTFNYAEMAALIAPRPFMVERGHNDGVGLDEYVAFEYAKVRRLYAKLGVADRTEIEFFQGGHEIHLRGTLAFLKKHLGR